SRQELAPGGSSYARAELWFDVLPLPTGLVRALTSSPVGLDSSAARQRQSLPLPAMLLLRGARRRHGRPGCSRHRRQSPPTRRRLRRWLPPVVRAAAGRAPPALVAGRAATRPRSRARVASAGVRE